MSIKLANFLTTTLAEDISALATTFAVASTSGWPTLGASDYFYLVLVRDADGAKEIIKVTSWSSGSVDVCVRGQESTDPLACVEGDTVKLAVTAATLSDAAAVPTVALTVGSGALAKTISLQVNRAGYFLLRAWLVDSATPSPEQSLNPPSGADTTQWELLTNAAGLATLSLAHVNASTTWYLCAVVVAEVTISGAITMGT